MSDGAVPCLNLAPRRKRPLSLWNPLDYLLLMYWSFFFPQALRWYVKTFGPDFGKALQEGEITTAVRQMDRVLRRLFLQVSLSIVLVIVSIFLCLAAFRIPMGGASIATGIMVGVGGAMAVGAQAVPPSVIFSLVLGVPFGVFLSLTEIPDSVAFCIAFSLAFGLMLGIVQSAGGVGIVARRVALGVSFGVSFGVCRGFTGGIGGVALGADSGVALGITAGLLAGRFLDWLVSSVLALLEDSCFGSRVAWLPLPRLQSRIQRWLDQDWKTGISNVNQILKYTFQYIPAIAAVNAELARSSEDQLLSRVEALAHEPIDWQLLYYGSADISKARRKRPSRSANATVKAELARLPEELRSRIAPWLDFLPNNEDSSDALGARRRLWQSLDSANLRFDSPARTACAAFWLWHDGEAKGAAEAFERLSGIPRGLELASIACAIDTAGQIGGLSDFANWYEDTAWLASYWVDALPEDRPRPGTVKTLEVMRSAAMEAVAALRAFAPLNRSTALARAADLLNSLLESGAETCPDPEWPLLHTTIEKWRDILVKTGGEAGRKILLQPVLNPYEGYSGLPVTGKTFVGRDDVLRQIETRWNTNDPPALVLYGHRRMGKTSILRNLEKGLRSGYLLVYLDMQDSANLIDHTGQVLLDFAEAIHQRTAAAALDPGPPPADDDYHELGRARRALNALLARLALQMTGDRRIILAVDEFEYIERAIVYDRLDPGLLPYLRAVNQRHRWLALIFAGLHTLDEMGRDYKSAFYGQTEHVRVGYLGYADAENLVRRPHPDFALEYADDLVDEICRLTYGQPYLVQRLCWELVRRWNERFSSQGETTSRTIELLDLEPVLDADFYAAADYYFDGVWKNVTEAERTLMTLVSQREMPWTSQELEEAGASRVDETLKLLGRHDVIAEDERGVRFASELLRRWVLDYRPVASN